MAQNRISAVLAQPDKDAVMAAIKTISDKMPFLLGIGPDERKSLPKLGDKSSAFVGKALELANQNPDFLPRSFDIDEFSKDAALYDDLSSIDQALSKVHTLLEDSMMIVGSEAYVAALVVYNVAKQKNIGTEGLESTIDELGKRFVRKARTVQPQTTK